MARPSKPVDLILMENKSHRTKAELQHRKEAEQALYTGESFKESKQVKDNEIAHKEFLRLKKLYDKISYIDALDEQIINRYCLEVANSHRLQDTLNRLDDDIKNCDGYEQRMAVYDMINKINLALNKNKEMLLKYEDRLFLNPTARIKSIPKTPEKQEELSGMAAFRKKRVDG